MRIAAGGCYTGLVGIFGKQSVAFVDISLGVDRIFAIPNEQRRKDAFDQGIGRDVYS